MKTVIATDGSLTADQVLPFVLPLAAEDTVTVLTVIEVPRALLADIRRVYGATDDAPVATDAEYVATSAVSAGVSGWPGDDTIIERYLDDQADKRAGALAADLEAAGLKVAVDAREGEDAASGVLGALDELEPDVVIAAATGRGLFQGLLGSTSTKLMRHAPCPVLLIRD
jgi:nucleotide-binding universal stress UspA family protein